jgi:hypothetical protein
MQIVKIRREPEPLNRALDILLDMRSRVGYAAAAKDVDAAFRGDCAFQISN